jgi:hypothetical protein
LIAEIARYEIAAAASGRVNGLVKFNEQLVGAGLACDRND